MKEEARKLNQNISQVSLDRNGEIYNNRIMIY